MKKIGLYVLCAIIGIVVIACGYCAIKWHIVQNKMYSYLETYGYTEGDIERVNLNLKFSGKNEWRIVVEFKKEPKILYRFTYRNNEIIKDGVAAAKIPHKEFIEYENMFENGELKYNSEKLEVSDMIYGDIIQEPQMVEAPEQNVRFPDSNPIYGGIGTHEIVGDKTIYYNDEYGISLRVREDFSGGMVQELNTTEALYGHEYLAHYISFSIRNDDIPEMYKIDGKGYEQNFLIVAYDNEEIEKWDLNSRFGNPEYYEILGKNNKYTFIITPKNKNYTDLYIFDVKESGDNQFLEDIKSSGEQPQGKNILITTEDEMDMNINLQIGNKTFDVVLEDNIATKALIEKLHEGDVVVNAREYGGFEKVGNLGFDLPRADKQITTEPGDLVLYQGNQISLFYESNSWSYTKLGKIQMISKDGLKEILGDGDVTLVFSLLK